MNLQKMVALIAALAISSSITVNAQDSFRLSRSADTPPSAQSYRDSSPIRSMLNAFTGESSSRVPDRINLRLPSAASASPPSRPAFHATVSAQDLARIGNHDVVLIIDKSGSMEEQDCPESLGNVRGILGLLGLTQNSGGAISRWDWCKEQAYDLARQTSGVLPEGMTVVLFSTDSKVFQHVDIRQVPQIFAMNSPKGTTHETEAIQMVFDDYFKRRDNSNGNVKPLLIAVITDGLPNSPGSVKRAIVQATKRMTRPDEIQMTFLQIGEDQKGEEFVQELAHNLTNQNAQFDIVDCKPFRDLLRTGLVRALVDCISNHNS